MKFFLDTASIKEIKEGIELSMVDGVTTNPTLLSKETGDPIEILKSISKIVKGPVSAEVISTDVEDMVKEGKKLADISENINIKIPVTFNGLKATRILQKKLHWNGQKERRQYNQFYHQLDLFLKILQKKKDKQWGHR